MERLIEKLEIEHSLTEEEYALLISGDNDELLRKEAQKIRESIYGKGVFIRGLIEISNICAKNCFYCGIRRDAVCERFRLSTNEILDCCQKGYELGFRTFVLQGGEDSWFTDERLAYILKTVKSKYPDCAVTLSLGERSYASYKALKEAGADRYLLRHETADKAHYMKLHPKDSSFENRIRCLNDLKSLGYQMGCGMMIGSPFQTVYNLAKDLKYIEMFKPDMCGVGPFIPNKGTPMGLFAAGSVELTLKMISIIRIMIPDILIPATTALSTRNEKGQEMGILNGANVIMPNISPQYAKEKYAIYDGKRVWGSDNGYELDILKKNMTSIGYEIVSGRGDRINISNGEENSDSKERKHYEYIQPKINESRGIHP